jgi:small subunit ribosomal protein S3
MILDIEKRMPFRRVMKQAISRVERAGALGVKIVVAGRLNGAEIARTEKLVSGKVPLQTLRADIDYSRGGAHTTYGIIGIKVWIYRGEVFSKDSKDETGQVVGNRQK